MTPLAHRLVKQLVLPVAERDELLMETKFPQMLNGAVCFDLTAVREMIVEIAPKFRKAGMDSKRAFLPAPKTWLEFAGPPYPDGSFNRFGYLLEQSADGLSARMYHLMEQKVGLQRFFWPATTEDNIPRHEIVGPRTLKCFRVPLQNSLPENRDRRALVLKFVEGDMHPSIPFQIYAALAIINTPRIIGRKQHMPHRGLEKNLLKNQRTIGQFPLHAWTEITLEATPRYVEDGQEHEAHLTGRKCLHFCRAHLRVRNGRLELVSSHWRGDPALGIKRSRYRVAA